MIPDIGETPYRVAKPLLYHTNPEQLYEFECKSPQIIGLDAEIWRAFIWRDFNVEAQNIKEPTDPKNWYSTYRRLARKQKEKNKADEMELQRKMDTLKSEKAKNTSRQAELDFVKPLPGLKSSMEAKEIIRTKKGARHVLVPESTKLNFRAIARSNGPTARTRSVPGGIASASAIASKANKSQLDKLRREVLDARRARPSVSSQLAQRSRQTKSDIVLAKDHEPNAKRRLGMSDESSVSDSDERRGKRIKVGTESVLSPKDTSHRAAKDSPPSKPAPPAVATLPMSSKRSLLPLPGQEDRSRTASPAAEGLKSAKRIKKAPVNIFMPAKRARVL